MKWRQRNQMPTAKWTKSRKPAATASDSGRDEVTNFHSVKRHPCRRLPPETALAQAASLRAPQDGQEWALALPKRSPKSEKGVLPNSSHEAWFTLINPKMPASLGIFAGSKRPQRNSSMTDGHRAMPRWDRWVPRARRT